MRATVQAIRIATSNAYILPADGGRVGARRPTGMARRCRPTHQASPESLTAGCRHSRTGWNYCELRLRFHPSGPWNVGSGSPRTQRHLRHDGQRLGMDGEPAFSGRVCCLYACALCVAGQSAASRSGWFPLPQQRHPFSREPLLAASAWQVFLSPVALPCCLALAWPLCSGGDAASRIVRRSSAPTDDKAPRCGALRSTQATMNRRTPKAQTGSPP